jgi:hypothetical protein
MKRIRFIRHLSTGATQVLKIELDNEELVKRFLLGGLSESGRAEVEDRFLANDDFFQELLIGEDDLIDAYVRGELPAAERTLFEKCCLSTKHGRQRVEFARTLLNSTSGKAERVVTTREQEDPTVSWWRSLFDKFIGGRPALSFALAAALLVVVLGGVWLLIERGRTRSTTDAEQARQTVAPAPTHESTSLPTNAPLEQEPSHQEKETSISAPSRESPKRAAPVVATFTLQPGMVRGESGSSPLALPGGATEVRLRLMLESGDYKQYRAALSTAEGRKLWGRVVTNRTSKKSEQLALSLPAELLKSGDYVLGLSGANADGKWESVADYSFRVVRK